MSENTQTLQEYLKDKKCTGFKPTLQYSQEGGLVNYYVSDEECYTEYIDKALDIHRSMKTGDIIGIRLWGISRLIAEERIKSLASCPLEDRE